MEALVYFNDGTSCRWWPLESFKGSHPRSDTTMELCFTPLLEEGKAPGKDNDIIVLTLNSANKHKEVMEAIAEAFVNPEDPLIIIFDSDESVSISSYIASFSVTFSSYP